LRACLRTSRSLDLLGSLRFGLDTLYPPGLSGHAGGLRC
jgi:hypothetical protein